MSYQVKVLFLNVRQQEYNLQNPYKNEEEIDATVLVGTNTCIASMRT